MLKDILTKLKESVMSVLPIYILVMILNLINIINLDLFESVVFSVSTIILIFGISLFNLGADIAMTPMGKSTGVGLTKLGKIGVLLIICFILGFAITVAEPDLSVLAAQTKAVFKPTILILSIGVGVGFFLVLSIIKTIFKVSHSHLLMFSYMILFAITLIAVITGNENIISLAYDSGGVTTGPITVPFLMALGLGVSSVVSNKSDKDASFGSIALCSVGPMIVILILSIFTDGNLTYELGNYDLTNNFVVHLFKTLFEKSIDVLIALGLIVVAFFICNFIFLKISKQNLKKIIIGVLYTFLGLVLFLSAVEVSYMSIGYKIGLELATKPKYVLIMISFLIGALTVLAEPAIHVLNNQVEQITGGLVSKKSLMIALTIGVGCAISLAMIRIIMGFSLLYIVIPGYIICLGLSFFIPKIYTAIAFDSGGVASGPLTSSFILPLGIGTCYTLSGVDAILTDAFGIVALVAMTPIITIECVGLVAIIRDKIKSKKVIKKVLQSDDEVIIKFM